MKLLLDSHAVIWFVDQERLLSEAARAAIVDQGNQLFVSAGTIWEIAIKHSLGKLELSQPLRDWLLSALDDLDAIVLPITVQHVGCQATLPFHHRDPFDRLLAAQSAVEQMPVVSRDSVFDSYDVQRIW